MNQCFCPAPLVDVRASGTWAVCAFCGGLCRNPFEAEPIRAADGRDWEDRLWDWVAERPRWLGFCIVGIGTALFWWAALNFLRWLFACAGAAGLVR